MCGDGWNTHKIKSGSEFHSYFPFCQPPTHTVYETLAACFISSMWGAVILMNVAWCVFSKYRKSSKREYWKLFERACLWACSNMCVCLVSCHALLLNINYLQLWRCVGGEDAGRKEGGWKINEYMPHVTPSFPLRVRLSGETLEWKETEGGAAVRQRKKLREDSLRQMDWWSYRRNPLKDYKGQQ